VGVNVSDPAEKPMVAKFDEKQLFQAFVSPGTASCLKAFQARKLVLLCVQTRSPQIRQVSLQQGVADFGRKTGQNYFGKMGKIKIVLTPFPLGVRKHPYPLT